MVETTNKPVPESVNLTREEFDTLIDVKKADTVQAGRAAASINRHTNVSIGIGLIVISGIVTVLLKIGSFQTADALWKEKLNQRLANATQDRWSGAMMIQLQDELKVQNADLNVVDAKGVKEIQKANPPYR